MNAQKIGYAMKYHCGGGARAMRREKYPTYDEKFIKFSSSIEKWLLTTVLVLFVSLLVTQTFLRVDSFRVWIVEVERLEGVAS